MTPEVKDVIIASRAITDEDHMLNLVKAPSI
jgi:hypothetical protein